MDTVDGHQPESPGLWFQSFGTEYPGHSWENEMDVKYQLVGCWCLEARDGATVLLPAVFANHVLDGGQLVSGRAGFLIFHRLMLRHEGSRLYNSTYERHVKSLCSAVTRCPVERGLFVGRDVYLAHWSQRMLASMFLGFWWGGASVIVKTVWTGQAA